MTSDARARIGQCRKLLEPFGESYIRGTITGAVTLELLTLATSLADELDRERTEHETTKTQWLDALAAWQGLKEALSQERAARVEIMNLVFDLAEKWGLKERAAAIRAALNAESGGRPKEERNDE